MGVAPVLWHDAAATACVQKCVFVEQGVAVHPCVDTPPTSSELIGFRHSLEAHTATTMTHLCGPRDAPAPEGWRVCWRLSRAALYVVSQPTHAGEN